MMVDAWGKLKRDSDNVVVGQLGLIEHCIDVAAVTAALLDTAGLRRRLERLAKRALIKRDVARLSVLALLHDVGKAAQGFQSKRLPPEQRSERLRRLGVPFDACGHTREAATVLFGDLAEAADPALGACEVLDWSDSYDLWLAAISHHGAPIQQTTIEPRFCALTANWRAAEGYDPMDALAQLRQAARAEYPAAFAVGADRLPDEPAFIHAFAGLVSLADWIGSNANGGFFPYDLAQGHDRIAASGARATRVLSEMRMEVSDARRDLAVRTPAFEHVFGFRPHPLQSAVADLALGPVVVAEAETGSGKTEAALWRFAALFQAGEVEALAFLLPTRVAATAMTRRVEAFMARLFPDPGLRPNVVMAVPGYLRADGQEGERDRLARFEVLWP